MKDDRFFNMISLAAKAGKVIFGGDKAYHAIRCGRAGLAVLAADASTATAKRVSDKCKSYGVAVIRYGSKQLLGEIAHKGETAAIIVTDNSFADELKRIGKEFTGVYEID